MKTIHKVAAMHIVDNNKFLMVRKTGKDIWTNLGGHIEPGETEEQALLREIKEELGCEAKIIKKLGDFRAPAAFDDAELLLVTFLVELSGDPVVSDPELEEFKYIEKNYEQEDIKLPQSIVEQVIPYCLRARLLNW